MRRVLVDGLKFGEWEGSRSPRSTASTKDRRLTLAAIYRSVSIDYTHYITYLSACGILRSAPIE